ncbi:unnamed protein product [Clavelina lepadiformis]|uniref:Exodeoxyribonuclease X-like C-terminal domain-containing protein n=1 Tax=Clavelina lepadiformis TaxID=159417 RepID=A0ABP0GGD4_CLALP
MSQVMDFGKYRGHTFQYVLDTDPGYARWAFNTFSKNARGKAQEDFLEFLIEHLKEPDLTKDPVLKTAWYTDPQAKMLVDYGLTPNLRSISFNNRITLDMTYGKEDDVDPHKYLLLLDKDLSSQYAGDLSFTVSLDFTNNVCYYLKPEIVNCALKVRKKFLDNTEADEHYKGLGQPSKIVLDYWLFPPESSRTESGRPTSTGKWTLFFNKLKENEDGLTDLDVCYQRLRDNVQLLNVPFKVSTRRPNPNASNFSQEKKKYYWKYHSSNYAKDGKKASNFFYDLAGVSSKPATSPPPSKRAKMKQDQEI